MSQQKDTPTNDIVADDDTEGHKKHFRIEDSGGEDTEGHSQHRR